MAGDWLKVEEVMPDKPEVFAIAARLDIDPDAVAGKLIRVWSWASRNCHGDGVTKTSSKRAIDRSAGVDGFADAMVEVGWLVASGDTLTFTNFDRHNSKTAKERGLAFIRKQSQRGRSSRKCHGVVPDLSRSNRDASVTKETETETYKETAGAVSRESRSRFVRPTVEEVRAYCVERNNHVDPVDFVDHYEANGWKRGKTPISDWKACVRTWEKNHDGRSNTAQRNPSFRHPDDAESDWLVADDSGAEGEG